MTTPDFTDEQIKQLATLELIETAQGDDLNAVAAFGRHVFGKVAAKHHRVWISEVLQNLRVGITAPPESAKTTWITIITMAWWIGKHPLSTNAIASAGEDSAGYMAKAVADTIEQNLRWRDVFPDVVPDKERGWSSDGYNVRDASVSPEEWARRRAGDKNPSLVGGGVGSARFNGLRVTGLFVMDDIHDRNSKTSAKVCAEAVGFVKDTALSRATKNARVAIVQTRWNKKDVINYIKALRRNNGSSIFMVFEHPAINAEGESYWPEEWPLERLEDKRVEMGEIDFRLVFLGDDKALEGTILKSSWLIPFPQIYIKKEFERFIGVDFARRIQDLTGGKTKDPDHFALAVMVNTDPILVVEDGFDGIVTMGDAEEVFFQWAALHNPRLSAIEVNSSGAEYMTNLIRRMNTRGIRYPLMPVNTTRNKGEKLTEMAGDFQFGLIKVSDAETPFLLTFKNQWAAFGGHTKDDTLDAVYLARKASAHLLPVETREERQERIKQAKGYVSPMKTIEAAYA